VLTLEIADGKMAPREKIIREPKIPELMRLFEALKTFESYKLPFKTHVLSQLGVMLGWTKIPLRELYKQLPENHEALHIQKQAADALKNKIPCHLRWDSATTSLNLLSRIRPIPWMMMLRRTSTVFMQVLRQDRKIDLHSAHYLPRFPCWKYRKPIINAPTVENQLHALAEDVKEHRAIPLRRSTATIPAKMSIGNSTNPLAKSFGLEEHFSGRQHS
jgi:hypothetical protein